MNEKTTATSAPDPYHGIGGRYLRDPETGERRPAPDDPPPADPDPEPEAPPARQRAASNP